ncbi:MAG: DEAD/DEAH box helicase family protein [Nitrospirae bacterium]|nr:DEAD/DEAH box helicase family protein [Nitrospirota bacterium]
MPATIDQLIINSPYEEPVRHWSYRRETRTFELKDGRRPAGYVRASEHAQAFDDPGVFVPLPLVNQSRTRVGPWRNADYPGVTGITKRLLAHWHDPEQRDSAHRLFFCSLEAIETVIWLTEASPAERQGIEIPSDGGPFVRLCCKMATGSGKTILMAMMIAWQVLNRVAYPQDRRFAKHVFVVAPGLTVKSRLQVLAPAGPGNYYDEFNLIPSGLHEKLRQGKVLIRNWHALMPLDPDAGPRVMKKGAESDEAFTRRVLGELAEARNFLVMNDEAHHAWRVPPACMAAGRPKSTIKGVPKEDIEEATQWIGGLDRLHKTRGILHCFDLSATPFAPTGRLSGEETLFSWIVSDFGLNDAIESGLVKTPRIVIRDDGTLTKEYKSRLYHIYMDDEVKEDLNRKAEPHEPLPDLVLNGYYLLGKDWLETAARWRAAGSGTPPVMITVANRTETAARVQYAITHGKVRIDELNAPEKTLHIDSKVLEKAEARDEVTDVAPSGGKGGEDEGDEAPAKKLSKKDQAEFLRQQVDTVGKVGKPGEQIQKVISVGMLSEGWDAKTVTHIMGLRAFSSQLLCEQVVGRGLRRTSYEVTPSTGLFEPEYVNIFGVPFTFLPHEGGDGPPPPPLPPPTRIEPVQAKREFEISWPNILRIDHDYRPLLSLDLARVKSLELDAAKTATLAEMAPVVEGKPDVTRVTEIDLEGLGKKFRTQKIVFEAARDVFDLMRPTWKGSREYLLAQLIGLVESYISSGKIEIAPPLFNRDELRRRILLTLNMTKIVQHLWEAIRFENTLALAPVFDTERPLRSTGDMRTWFTRKPSEKAKKSHINECVYDSTWEATEAFILDHESRVAAWVKNDHLGFDVTYVSNGVVRKYRPDFLIRLTNGRMLALEIKGEDSQENQTKREFLSEWIRAVNEHGDFGKWAWDVSRHPKDVSGILEKHAASA